MMNERKLQRIWAAIVLGSCVVFVAYLVLAPLVTQIVTQFDFSGGKALSLQFKQIGFALHEYYDTYQSFPPAYVEGPDGKPWHSWRVLILPFLGEKELYAQYRFDEPWDGPHNKALIAERPKVFASPRQVSDDPNVAVSLAVVSPQTMWPGTNSVSLNQVFDGTSNTIQLVEYQKSDVIWSEPRDLKLKEVLKQFPLREKNEKIQSNPNFFFTLFVDETVRPIPEYRIERDLFVSLLTPVHGGFVAQKSGKQGHSQRTPLPELQDPSHYLRTKVLTTPDQELQTGKSAIYCATTQIAWDLLRPEKEARMEYTGDSPIAKSLIENPFPLESLDPASYFAGTGRNDDGTDEKMLAEFVKKFPHAKVNPFPPPEVPGQILFAYLQKSLPFPDEMQKFPDPLEFHTSEMPDNVESFGWLGSNGESNDSDVLEHTVRVADYVSDEDFIVVLSTDTEHADEIILAKIASEKTLREVWNTTQKRLSTPLGKKVYPGLQGVDQLQIPIISFGIEAELTEIKGLGVPTGNLPLRYIDCARQTMRFRLDEFGAELVSDQYFLVADFEPMEESQKPIKPRKFVFDRPFFIALKEKEAEVPYFLAWMGNAELLVRSP